jgi:beta-glucosidase
MRTKLVLLAVTLAVLCPSGFAQTNAIAPVTHRNSALIPEPRKGRAATRQTLVLQRARENQGDCDLEFIGDSITQFWEKGGQNVWGEYYGKRKALNFGVTGDQIQNLLWRFSRGQLDGVKPKVAIVMIGTNNSNRNDNSEAEILEGIKEVVNEVRTKQPGAKVLVLGIFPRGATFCPERGKILQVNQALARMDDGKNIFYLDVGSQFVSADGSISKDIMSDGIHPTAAGYAIWAKAMEPKLKELLAE